MKSLRNFSLLLTFILLSFISFSQNTGCVSGDCKNGMGTWRWSTGDMYTGQWINDLRTGVGEYVWNDGSFYFGFFNAGKLEGSGFYQNADGQTVLSGIFENNNLKIKQPADTGNVCAFGNCTNGTGIFFWADGSSYVGDWENGSRTGYGRYDWADGAYYYGALKNNLLDGYGFYVDATGKEMKGGFVNNHFVAEDISDKDDQLKQNNSTEDSVITK